MNSQTMKNINQRSFITLIIKVFNNFLNESTDLAVFTYSGSLFHKRGAAHRKEGDPKAHKKTWLSEKNLLFERNCLSCLYGVRRFEIYNGDILNVDL